MYAYLTVTAGNRAGTTFLLDPTDECRIGRGSDCAIVLNDPLCSRVHAVLAQEGEGWRIRDADSRNGTYVNGQKIDEATLDDGHRFRVGSTEFAFQRADQPPTVGTGGDGSLTQTIIMDQPVNPAETGSFTIEGLRGAREAEDLVALYELSVKLLACDDPDEVSRIALDLLHQRTKAAVVGFLWASEDGRLKPRRVIPEESAGRVSLSEALTKLVCKQGHAVWVANQQSDEREKSLRHYADGLCVPLVHGQDVLGAIHVYLEKGRFRQSDFQFTISLANVVVVALVRARRQSSLQTDFQRLVARTPGYEGLVGESPPMQELKSKIGRLARATGCVLIRGESGSGKELVARALHRASPRADRPMLSVNCAAIPVDLMESQLFGHKAGAFTGADRDHAGFFQQADLGTLFLDEIGEMTLEGQAKLLRILDGYPFHAVGGTQEISVDVRVIAATNQDLQRYVQEKKFREDLYYRLSVFELKVPPLRERGQDIGLLIDFFLDHFRRQHGRPNLALSEAARAKLLEYQWPGNVRQLRNVIDSAVVLADEPQIGADDLDLRGSTRGDFDTLRLDHWEKRLIGEALRRSGGNVPEAAKLLGIGRATLYRKIEEYGFKR